MVCLRQFANRSDLEEEKNNPNHSNIHAINIHHVITGAHVLSEQRVLDYEFYLSLKIETRDAF